MTYFTVGPKETRAWTITAGTRAPGAAGVIHSDFEKGFIRSETIAYDDYVANKGEAGARDAGKFRLEGKDYVANKGEAGARDAGKFRLEGKEYVVADGDVLHFRFNN